MSINLSTCFSKVWSGFVRREGKVNLSFDCVLGVVRLWLLGASLRGGGREGFCVCVCVSVLRFGLCGHNLQALI